MLETGAKLPAIKLADDSGTQISTRDLLGKHLVLYFYPKDDTPGCTNEATQFRDLFEDFEKKGAAIVGVSRDSVASHVKFKTKYEIPFTLLADIDSELCHAFGVIVEKNMYGKKSMGVAALDVPLRRQRQTRSRLAQSQRRRSRRGRAVETVENPTLTILGSSCSIPRPARASSAYLFETREATIVADLGTGGFANLVRFRTPESVDAVVISHMHADHFIDVIPLRYALRYGARTHDRRVKLFLPPGGSEILHGMVTPFAGEAGAFLDDVFEIVTYDPKGSVTIGDVTVTFAPTTHYIACYAMRFATPELTFVYSADTAPDAAVAELAHGATYLLCEATLTQEEEALEPRGHLSSREAGTLATQSGARALFLSHYPASAKPPEMAHAAATTFAGPIRVVDDANRYDLVLGLSVTPR